MRREELRGTTRVLRGPLDIELHHQLLRRVGLADLGALAVIEVRREGVEAFTREHVRGALHLRDEPPPFLDDQHPGALAGRGAREVAAGRTAVALETDRLA